MESSPAPPHLDRSATRPCTGRVSPCRTSAGATRASLWERAEQTGPLSSQRGRVPHEAHTPGMDEIYSSAQFYFFFNSPSMATWFEARYAFLVAYLVESSISLRLRMRVYLYCGGIIKD